MTEVVNWRNCRINVAKKVLKPGCEKYFHRYKVIIIDSAYFCRI